MAEDALQLVGDAGGQTQSDAKKHTGVLIFAELIELFISLHKLFGLPEFKRVLNLNRSPKLAGLTFGVWAPNERVSTGSCLSECEPEKFLTVTLGEFSKNENS